jgi:hypothetical protein
VIGWNGGHTAVTLPDGTPVSAGEGGGVHIGGAGAFQPGFSHHMYLPMDLDLLEGDVPAPDAPTVLVDAVAPEPAAPAPDLPAPDPGPVGEPDMATP